MIESRNRKINFPMFFLAIGLFTALYIIQLNNYLLFHFFAEIFSIVIAFSVFLIVWNGRRYLKEHFLLLYGLAYLFIGFIDLLHTLGYSGMAIFRDYDFYANQFWIAGRFLEAGTLLAGSLIIQRKKAISVKLTLSVYVVLTAAFAWSILFSDIFPECFVAGVGQTPFKIVSEYIIIVILAAAMVNFIRQKRFFERDTFSYMWISILFTMLSELAFIFYIDNYGLSNMFGHYAKIVSFYCIYRAIVKKNIVDPYDSIFRELTRSNNLKTRLFSIISHDLSGPMSSTTYLLSVLDDEFDDLDADQRREYVAEIRKSQDTLAHQLRNLLEWSRIELSGKHRDRHRCDPIELINTTINDLKVVSGRKNIRISLESDDKVFLRLDPDSFAVVIRNILSNAIKFSEDSAGIEIACKNDAKKVRIDVVDHGIGMDFDPSMLEVSVNRSTRGTAGEKGTGLGLYMIKKYTEENGGTLKIQSEKGTGTIVTLEFAL